MSLCDDDVSLSLEKTPPQPINFPENVFLTHSLTHCLPTASKLNITLLFDDNFTYTVGHNQQRWHFILYFWALWRVLVIPRRPKMGGRVRGRGNKTVWLRLSLTAAADTCAQRWRTMPPPPIFTRISLFAVPRIHYYTCNGFMHVYTFSKRWLVFRNLRHTTPPKTKWLDKTKSILLSNRVIYLIY